MPTSKEVWLLCWKNTYDDIPKISFEFSTSRLWRGQGVIRVFVRRNGRRVTAFSDYIHGHEPCSKSELEAIAECYLDGNYTTTHIDLGW